MELTETTFSLAKDSFKMEDYDKYLSEGHTK